MWLRRPRKVPAEKRAFFSHYGILTIAIFSGSFDVTAL